MPELDWIGKEYVINHAKEVPFRLLERVSEASVGEGSGNVIVHGDNLEALKALLPYYRERVKLVFIDPPYNTGNGTPATGRASATIGDPRPQTSMLQVVTKANMQSVLKEIEEL